MIRRVSLLSVAGLVLCGFALLATPQAPAGFPLSAWSDQKTVTQVPWNIDIGKPNLRPDLREELRIGLLFRRQDLEKLGDTHDLVLYGRVLEQGRAITKVHSVTPLRPVETGTPSPLRPPVGVLRLIALVKPGKYRVELALLDRASGRYSTRFENITIDRRKNDPLERSFDQFPHFEFVEPAMSREGAGDARLQLDDVLLHPPVLRGGTLSFLKQRPTSLGAFFAGASANWPTFSLDSPQPTTLSVIAILSPPERGLGDATYERIVQGNMTNLLGVFSRLRVARGTAHLTAVDLIDSKVVFDRRDMTEITPETIRAATNKDTSTISLEALTRRSENPEFLRNLLSERFAEAGRDASDTNRVFIIVGARSTYPKASLVPISANCRCQVFYVRFGIPNEPDDMERFLKLLKPQMFEPLSWEEFREDFGKIYAQLQR